MKKFLSLLLALCLCVGLLPVAAMAEGETNWIDMADTSWYSDASASSYTISSAAQLAGLAKLVNTGYTFEKKTIVLDANIDLNGKEWTPIGKEGKTFNGIFDGGNKTISNLTITSTEDNIGLFGFTQKGEIKNFTLNNAKVKGDLSVGAVSGQPYTSKYTNIKLSGLVQVDGRAYVGGMLGKNAYANLTDLTIDVDTGSYVKADSGVYRTYVGGLVGFMGEGNTVVKNVTSNIDVIGSTCDVGGIAGIAHYGNKFENVTCTGNVTLECANDAGDQYEIGGIAGVWHNESGETVSFKDCSSTGTLKTAIKGTDGSPVDCSADVAGNDITGKNYEKFSDETGKLVFDDKQVVAVIGNNKYTSLDDAVADAKEGDQIDLLADAEPVKIDKPVTVSSNKYNTTKIKVDGKLSSTKDDTNGTITLAPRTDTDPDNVAKVGDTFYGNLADAIAAANGDTVTLLKDVTLSEMIIVDKNVTLDLNGKTIAAADDWELKVLSGPYSVKSDSMLAVTSGAKLTITDSSADKTGTITTGSTPNAYAAIKLTLVKGNDESKTAELEVNGGTIIGYYYGIIGNGKRHNTKITINGGIIKGQAPAPDNNVGIYHPQGGELIITGGMIEGDTGLIVKSGRVSITGGTIRGTGTKKAYKHNSNGYESTGDGLYVEECNYPGGAPAVTIMGGTFESANGNKIGFYKYDENAEDNLAETKTDNEYLADKLKSGWYLNEQGEAVRDANDLTWLLPVLGALNKMPFDDVTIGDWFYDDVNYVNEYGLMTGTAANHFSPNAPVTRGMVMTILARREGIRTDRYSPWYAAGVEWSKAVGISDGTNPEAAITREQLATMLYRYAQLKDYDLSGAALASFGDANSVSGYAVPAVQWAVGAGLLTGAAGLDAGKLLPQQTATRAQLAAMLHRFFG